MAHELRKGPSGPPLDPDFGKVVIRENGVDQGVAGVLDFEGLNASVDDDTGVATITLAATGFLARVVLTPTSDGLIWSAIDQLTPGIAWNWVQVEVTGAGGGGSSGTRSGAANQAGGSSAGGGGYRNSQRFSRQQIQAALPIAMTLPSGGPGGIGASSSSGTGNNNVAGGTPTGPTIFGGLMRAFHGCGGNATGGATITDLITGGTGGGLTSAGQSSTSNIPLNGGFPNGSTTPAGAFNGAGSLASVTAGVAGQSAIYGGASGAGKQAGGVPGNNNGQAGASTTFGGASGGAGGAFQGGVGGEIGNGGNAGRSGSDTTAATGGLASGTAGVGNPGGDGDPGTDQHAGGGGAGGGFKGGSAIVATVTGGRGGNGGDPGGGGGGGGSANAQTGSTSTAGDGGRGGHSEIRLIFFA